LATLLSVVDQLSDIDWLPSDESDDQSESVVGNDRRAAAAAAANDDDVDNVLSIDVQDSPIVSVGMTKSFPTACLSQVCHSE